MGCTSSRPSRILDDYQPYPPRKHIHPIHPAVHRQPSKHQKLTIPEKSYLHRHSKPIPYPPLPPPEKAYLRQPAKTAQYKHQPSARVRSQKAEISTYDLSALSWTPSRPEAALRFPVKPSSTSNTTKQQRSYSQRPLPPIPAAVRPGPSHVRRKEVPKRPMVIWSQSAVPLSSLPPVRGPAPTRPLPRIPPPQSKYLGDLSPVSPLELEPPERLYPHIKRPARVQRGRGEWAPLEQIGRSRRRR